MKNKYRIVRDGFAGYEAQVKFWWMPFVWWQMNELGGINTFKSIERAQDFIALKRSKKFKKPNTEVWRSDTVEHCEA